jgi:hypothetical protein
MNNNFINSIKNNKDYLEENKKCYEYEKKIYNDSLLGDCIDATYIINLKNNGRYKDIIEQLKIYHPTNILYILINTGYKKCEKILPYNTPPYDLTDAFLQIFKHSTNHNYNNILILEDDFIFSRNIFKKNIQKDISLFLNSKKDEKFVYYFGCIPYIQSVGIRNHNKLYLSSGTHACVYSKSLRKYVLDKSTKSIIGDWDIFNNINILNYPRYVYNIPLCYQLFPDTENSKYWSNLFYVGDISKYIMKIYLLNKQCEPGYTKLYILSKFIYLFILIILIIIILIILYFLFLKKNIVKIKKLK